MHASSKGGRNCYRDLIFGADGKRKAPFTGTDGISNSLFAGPLARPNAGRNDIIVERYWASSDYTGPERFDGQYDLRQCKLKSSLLQSAIALVLTRDERLELQDSDTKQCSQQQADALDKVRHDGEQDAHTGPLRMVKIWRSGDDQAAPDDAGQADAGQ